MHLKITVFFISRRSSKKSCLWFLFCFCIMIFPNRPSMQSDWLTRPNMGFQKTGCFLPTKKVKLDLSNSKMWSFNSDFHFFGILPLSTLLGLEPVKYYFIWFKTTLYDTYDIYDKYNICGPGQRCNPCVVSSSMSMVMLSSHCYGCCR